MHNTEKHLCPHGVDVLETVVDWGRQCYRQCQKVVSSMSKLKWGPGRGMPNEEEGQLYMGCSKETSTLRLTSERRPKACGWRGPCVYKEESVSDGGD